MTKIDSQHYMGFDIQLDYRFPIAEGKHYAISLPTGLTFPTLKAARAAIDLWRKPFERKWLCMNYKKWFSIAWLLAINPNNYSGCYGRLTKKRLELRKKLLK